MKVFQQKLNILIVCALFILVHQSKADSEEEDNPKGYDFMHYHEESDMDFKEDPFFSDFYHHTYDPIKYMSEVDPAPYFTYHYDHIDPHDVDLPEHSADATNQKEVVRDPRNSDGYDGDDRFYEFYNRYFKDKSNNEPDDEESEHSDDDEHEHDHDKSEHEDEADDADEEEHTFKRKKKDKKKKDDKKKEEDKKEDDHKKKLGDRHKKPAVFIEEPHPSSDEIQYKYTIDFSPSEEYERIKAISDKQRDELKANPGGCKIYTSDDGQKCYECYDPKSGDTSESCSYEEDPTPERYAYASQKSYDSKNEPPSDDDFEDEETNDEKSSTSSPQKGKGKSNSSEKKSEQIKVAPVEEEKEEEDDSFYDYDAETTDNDSLDDEDSGKDAEVLQPYKHSFFFSAPQKTHEENKKAKESSYPYSPVYDTHTDVDAALKEFSSRDWSNCEKQSKGDLTCYRCKDEKGVKHEECMFVQESRPKGVRVAYKNSKYKVTTASPEKIATTSSPFKISLTTATPRITTLKRATFRGTPATPTTQNNNKKSSKQDDDSIVSKKKSKKIVIVKRRKPEDDIDPVNKGSRSDDGFVEKRTIKRTIAVSLTGNGAMPANYTSTIIDAEMKNEKFKM